MCNFSGNLKEEVIFDLTRWPFTVFACHCGVLTRYEPDLELEKSGVKDADDLKNNALLVATSLTLGRGSGTDNSNSLCLHRHSKKRYTQLEKSIGVNDSPKIPWIGSEAVASNRARMRRRR